MSAHTQRRSCSTNSFESKIKVDSVFYSQFASLFFSLIYFTCAAKCIIWLLVRFAVCLCSACSVALLPRCGGLMQQRVLLWCIRNADARVCASSLIESSRTLRIENREIHFIRHFLARISISYTGREQTMLPNWLCSQLRVCIFKCTLHTLWRNGPNRNISGALQR